MIIVALKTYELGRRHGEKRAITATVMLRGKEALKTDASGMQRMRIDSRVSGKCVHSKRTVYLDSMCQ